MKQTSLILGMALLSSCASTRAVSQPAESVAPPTLPAPAEADAAPATSTPAPVVVPAADPLPTSRISIYLGTRGLDSRLWGPVEDQFAFGVEYSRETPGSSFGWEVGSFLAGESANIGPVKVKSSSWEVYGGVRKTFGEPEGPWHPYIAGGLSLQSAEFEVAGVADSDSAVGLYAHGGTLYDITDSMYLGVDLRTLFGSSVTLAGLNGDADYWQLAVMLGWAF